MMDKCIKCGELTDCVSDIYYRVEDKEPTESVHLCDNCYESYDEDRDIFSCEICGRNILGIYKKVQCKYVEGGLNGHPEGNYCIRCFENEMNNC